MYWEDRKAKDMEEACRKASSFSSRYKKAIAARCKEMCNYIDGLLLAVTEHGRQLTRSELYRMEKYLELINKLQVDGAAIAQEQQELLHTCLLKVTGIAAKDLNQEGFNVLPQQQLATAIDTAWSGDNYSRRIWRNTQALSQKLQKDIEDMIIMGKNSNDIKAKVREDFGVSYRVADRLIRTESAYVYVKANLEAYKSKGVKYVRYLHGGSCGCQDCKKNDQKIFAIGTEPLIPMHPNCVCCYAPVVEVAVSFV